MARIQTLVQLNEELLKQLDGEAHSRGVSRSALIREAIEESLAASREAEIGRRIAAGYRRIPQGKPDAWGDLAELSRLAAIRSLQRLDEEDGGW